jgi:hypothetical protein
MAADQERTDTAGEAFIAKLNTFRAGLDENGRQMLDALVEAARQAHEQGDVEVYWFSTASSLPNPGILGAYGAYSGTATYTGMGTGGV